MLADGEPDALYTPRVPRGFGEGRVRRLFAQADPEPDGRGLLDVRAGGNSETLRTFVRYSFEQGLIKRQLPVDELFAAETREEYVI
jgi:hypothetical protein